MEEVSGLFSCGRAAFEQFEKAVFILIPTKENGSQIFLRAVFVSFIGM